MQNQKAAPGLQCYLSKESLIKHSRGQIANKSQVMQVAVIINRTAMSGKMVYQAKTKQKQGYLNLKVLEQCLSSELHSRSAGSFHTSTKERRGIYLLIR